VVSFYLIFTTLPVTVCYVLYLTFPEGDPTIADPHQRASRSLTFPKGDPTITDPEARAADPVWRRFVIYWSVRTVVEEIGLSHYACNFYIYLLTGHVFNISQRPGVVTGHVFRRQLRRLLCGASSSTAAQRW